MGVNYCAMGKYTQPASAEQWQHCAASLKVSRVSASLLYIIPGQTACRLPNHCLQGQA